MFDDTKKSWHASIIFHPFQFMDVLKIDVGSMFDSMFHQYDPSIFPRKSAEAEESQPLSSEVPEGGDSRTRGAGLWGGYALHEGWAWAAWGLAGGGRNGERGNNGDPMIKNGSRWFFRLWNLGVQAISSPRKALNLAIKHGVRLVSILSFDNTFQVKWNYFMIRVNWGSVGIWLWICPKFPDVPRSYGSSSFSLLTCDLSQGYSAFLRQTHRSAIYSKRLKVLTYPSKTCSYTLQNTRENTAWVSLMSFSTQISYCIIKLGCISWNL